MSIAWEWVLLGEECTGCGICRDVCSFDAILMTEEAAYPASVEDACAGCLECEQECPFGAIEVRCGEGAAAKVPA